MMSVFLMLFIDWKYNTSKEFNAAAFRDIYKFNFFCNRKREYFSTLCKKSREIKPSSAS